MILKMFIDHAPHAVLWAFVWGDVPIFNGVT